MQQPRILDDEDLQEQLYQEHLEAQGIEADFNQLQAEQWENDR